MHYSLIMPMVVLTTNIVEHTEGPILLSPSMYILLGYTLLHGRCRSLLG
jgi:hypothetical protein